jgi:hypothetical protein
MRDNTFEINVISKDGGNNWHRVNPESGEIFRMGQPLKVPFQTAVELNVAPSFKPERWVPSIFSIGNLEHYLGLEDNIPLGLHYAVDVDDDCIPQVRDSIAVMLSDVYELAYAGPRASKKLSDPELSKIVNAIMSIDAERLDKRGVNTLTYRPVAGGPLITNNRVRHSELRYLPEVCSIRTVQINTRLAMEYLKNKYEGTVENDIMVRTELTNLLGCICNFMRNARLCSEIDFIIKEGASSYALNWMIRPMQGVHIPHSMAYDFTTDKFDNYNDLEDIFGE